MILRQWCYREQVKRYDSKDSYYGKILADRYLGKNKSTYDIREMEKFWNFFGKFKNLYDDNFGLLEEEKSLSEKTLKVHKKIEKIKDNLPIPFIKAISPYLTVSTQYLLEADITGDGIALLNKEYMKLYGFLYFPIVNNASCSIEEITELLKAKKTLSLLIKDGEKLYERMLYVKNTQWLKLLIGNNTLTSNAEVEALSMALRTALGCDEKKLDSFAIHKNTSITLFNILDSILYDLFNTEEKVEFISLCQNVFRKKELTKQDIEGVQGVLDKAFTRIELKQLERKATLKRYEIQIEQKLDTLLLERIPCKWHSTYYKENAKLIHETLYFLHHNFKWDVCNVEQLCQVLMKDICKNTLVKEQLKLFSEDVRTAQSMLVDYECLFNIYEVRKILIDTFKCYLSRFIKEECDVSEELEEEIQYTFYTIVDSALNIICNS